ncbi:MULTISPECIES: transporter [Polymorphospora]|uniref:Transporter n=1 Tax=Polymorphospora lycopeni TaxID=3140240 RepID=A0ABV5CQY1_9ACTN
MRDEFVDDLRDAPPPDPVAALRLIERQRAEAIRRFSPDPRLYHWPWGLAWLIVFGLFFLRYGPGGRTFVAMPDWLPLAVLAVAMIAVTVFTAVTSSRTYSQISGESARRGAWYGYAWFVGFAGLFATLARVTPALPPDLRTLAWSAAPVALTGVLYLAGGAVWLDRNLFVLGAWISGSNIVGVVAGPGWHSLVTALAGGGGMLVTGWLLHRAAVRATRGHEPDGVGASG